MQRETKQNSNMTKKNKGGRPPLPEDQRLEARYNVLVNRDMYNDLERASKRSGTRPEQLIRKAIDKYIN